MTRGTLVRQDASANLLAEHSVDKVNATPAEHSSLGKSVVASEESSESHEAHAPLERQHGSRDLLGGQPGKLTRQNASSNLLAEPLPETRWARFKKSARGIGSAIGGGIADGVSMMGEGISKGASIVRGGLSTAGKKIGKVFGYGLTEQEELEGLNPEYEQRFGTKTGTKKVIMGAGSVAATAGLGTGIGLKAAGEMNNLSDSAKLNIGGSGALLGGVLGVGLGIKGILSGSKRLNLAKKHNDHAGQAIAAEDIASNSVGLTKGAIGVTSAGVQFAGAAGNIGVGVAKGVASGLGAATGALTIAEGLFKGGVDVMHLHKTRTFKPLSDKGKDWRSHIVKKKSMRVGVNALKVIGGALGVAGSVLSGGALAVGLAAASAGIGIGMALTKVGKGMAQREKMKAARKADPDYKKENSKEVSKENIAKANEFRKTTKTGSIAFEMIEAVKKISTSDLEKMRKLHIASQKGPGMKDKMLDFFKRFRKDENVVNTQINIKLAEDAQISAKKELDEHSGNFETYDAHELLTAIGISKEEAVSASGQELIEKKISVTSSL